MMPTKMTNKINENNRKKEEQKDEKRNLKKRMRKRRVTQKMKKNCLGFCVFFSRVVCVLRPDCDTTRPDAAGIMVTTMLAVRCASSTFLGLIGTLYQHGLREVGM